MPPMSSLKKIKETLEKTMKFSLLSFLLLITNCFGATSDPYSREHLERFYDTFLEEEKIHLDEFRNETISTTNIDPYSRYRLDRFYNLFLEEEAVHLDAHGNYTGGYNPNAPLNPPGPDVYYGDYLPFTFANNTGTASDAEIYVNITGLKYDNSNIGVILQFDPSTGKGSIYNFGDTTGQTSDYAIALSSLPKQQHGLSVLYSPEIQSARVWFSIGKPLQMEMTAPATLVEPNFKSPTDPNYNITYDFFEYNFQKVASPQIVTNATAVDFFSMPTYLYLNNATSKNSNCGLHQRKSLIFSTAKAAFQSATFDSIPWLDTILSNNLRIISPGKAAASNPILFDLNFYQNGTYNYIDDIWTGGSSSYYATHPLTIQLEDGTTFVGAVNTGADTIVLNGGGGTVTFKNPALTSYTYSLSVSILTQDDTLTTSSGIPSESRKEVENLFTQGILSGLVPTTATLSKANFQTLTSQYFTVSPNLSSALQTNGPWYSLYSKALLSLGNIYTMSVSEDLYPDVQISSPYVENSSYVGVTLGSLN